MSQGQGLGWCSEWDVWSLDGFKWGRASSFQQLTGAGKPACGKTQSPSGVPELTPFLMPFTPPCAFPSWLLHLPRERVGNEE